MKIIIPMAGHSRRFKKAGYKTPKPFIMINDKPMIEWACEMFSPEDEFIFICNKEHLANSDYRRMLESIVFNYHIVEIDPHEYGPVYSAMQARKFIDNEDDPVIISYADFVVEWNRRQFLLKAAHYDGAIPVFRGFHPASFGGTYYAYAKANEDLEMMELREKNSFTDNRANEYASTGTYYIENWKTFKHYADELLKTDLEGNSEYYCSLIFNLMVRDGKHVCLFEVEKFVCWGTPEDFEEYIFWSEYFLKDAKNTTKNSIYGAR